MYDRLETVSRMLDWVGLEHRVNYEPMLERLGRELPADALRVLADASEALGNRGTARCTAVYESGGFEPFRRCGQAGERERAAYGA